ncbi:MAG: ABC transporter ATP-binding protein [Oscillospiraceae bacterium]|jgi:iron complex transport system ATP-binding protein|nr:ABC transporter ATP-binding protein [Oscillospiraceae bacterium]
MKSHIFAAENIIAGYGGEAVVSGIDISVPSSKISVMLGANACGKSTLLKTMSRILKPDSGSVTLDGVNIERIPSKKLARRLGLLPQSPIAPEGIAVSDLVGRGRFPHQKLWGGFSKADYEAVSEALDVMGISDLCNRNVDELSGGQRQRVWIAMALAQQTDILLLDEPTTFLDIAHQVEILDLLTDLNRSRGTTIVMVLHDINLAARYADHIFAMRGGKLIAEGAPKKVITADLVQQTFDLECTVITDPISNTPIVLPVGRHHRAYTAAN